MRLFKLAIMVAPACGLLPSLGLGEEPYGVAGCGLGAIIFKPTGPQTSAATSNQLYYNQAFGITSGTSKCKPLGGEAPKSAARQEQEMFVAANLTTLENDVSKGEGDSVSALAQVLGCRSELAKDLGPVLQARYNTIFASVGSVNVLDSIVSTLSQTNPWSSECLKLETNQAGE